MFMPKRALLATAISTALFIAPSSYGADNIDDAVNTDFEIIVVSGTKTEKPLKDVAGSISVITEQDIEKQLVTDMSQLFKYDPSVQVTGNTGGAQNIIVRGMGGDRVLMIKDGMRMNEGYGANGLNDIVGRGFIETDTLKQVEVAKGASSSLYGSDALGGIIVFTTKDASDYLTDGETFAGNVKVGYTDDGEQGNIGTTFALATGDFEQVLNLSYRNGAESQNYAETKPALDIESNSVFYKAKYNFNEDSYLSFTADVWHQDVTGDVAYGLLGYFRDLDGYTIVDENSESQKDNQSFQLRFHSESPTAIYDMLNVSVYANSTEQEDVEYGQLDINANYGYPLIEIRDMWKTSVYKQETQGFLSNASLALNETHTIGYGLDIEQSTSSRTESKLYSVEGTPKPGYPQESDKFPETDVFRAGFFINDEISLLDNKLIITPGARFDIYEMDANGALKEDGTPYADFDENHLSLSIGGLYKFTETIAGFVQYGQGFKVPAYDLAYIEHDNSMYGYKIVPSDDLAPEESDNFEIGLRGHTGDFFFSTAIYYSQFDNFLATEVIGHETVTDPYTGQDMVVAINQYQNIDSVTLKGIEAAVRYHLNDSVSVFANAAYQDGKDDATGDYLTSISPLSGITGVSYEVDALSAELILNWATRMDKVNEGNAEVAGYGTVDFLASYQVSDEFRVNLALTNLTDKEYVKYLNGAGHKDNSTLMDVTEAGRGFAVSMRYDF
ncbi:TonB-dependent hemoglobin/transferrin/lactoferrin family receptor [Colwellia psychrerythraea]|uniref:TonB-dependent hemoglobin/transferrin/lactoferrin family receptor n=1 Tax=Colwellia psychrerythraea TaxID=28229 RepID=A0A099L193_COLPS|nr:TonB-dependent hemoglobin/transferrin/lactoferrin family receptor [Colwellia psychrerythraea]KGJ96215.1 TonB-dependent hemoglobin/transferrin/lactoferrin family receptor [Colwellia psychrerythraea]